MEELRKIIREELQKVINEGRMVTHTGQIASDIKKLPGIEKTLGINYTASGVKGLYRYEDGNVYEVVITPASLIKDKEFWGNVLKKKTKPEDQLLKKAKGFLDNDEENS